MSRFIGRLCAAALILACLAPAAAHAQLSNANVVAACGTPNTTYPSGATRAITQDTTGTLCTAGGSTVTVTNPFALETTQLANKADLDALVAAAGLPAGILGTNGSTIASSSNPLDTRLGDGTNRTTVKAASTAPSTTDTALVVTQSPNAGTSPCTGAPIPINQTTSTDLKTFTNTGRLCSIYISNATSTQGWSLANGTGTLCATGINYMIGGAGGTTQGSFVAANDRTLLTVSATANHLCLIQSGATNLSGFITYSDQP